MAMTGKAVASDIGAVPGGGSLGNRFNRFADARVIFGNHDDHNRKNEPDQCCEIDINPGNFRYSGKGRGTGHQKRDGCQNGGTKHTLVEGAHDILTFPQFDEKDRDHGSDNRNGAQYEGKVSGDSNRWVKQISQEHGGNRRYRVSFKQVGRHTGAVTHIVTNVVGNGCRVTRIVFGNSGFNFTHQVRAHISALGEDPAAQSRKNGDQASAKSQGHQRNHGMPDVNPGSQQDGIKTGHRRQRQTGNDHPGNGTAPERQGQPFSQAAFGRFGGTHVGYHRHPHPNVTGGKRCNRANQKADGRRKAQGKSDDDKQYDSGNAHAFKLTVQVSNGPCFDGVGNIRHFRIAGRGALDHDGKYNGKDHACDPNQCANQRY